jgi:hypothetical protein
VIICIKVLSVKLFRPVVNSKTKLTRKLLKNTKKITPTLKRFLLTHTLSDFSTRYDFINALNSGSKPSVSAPKLIQIAITSESKLGFIR